MRGYIHFCDNDKRKAKGKSGYNPLFKVKWITDEIMKGIQKLCIAGQHIAIDKSMIKHMGRAITFVQFMKNKPIKHGIKVFACCYAYSGVILSFFVYCGKENTS